MHLLRPTTVRICACLAWAAIWPPFAATAAAADAGAARQFWPAWRGPLGTGAAPEADPPVEWSEAKNVRWKAVLPGLGHSTPIVWGERIFLTTAVPFGDPVGPFESQAPGAHDNLSVTHHQRFIALAVDRRDGRILWQRALREALPAEAGHQTASLASGSAVTDGERVFFPFGSQGIYALDVAGNPLWQVDLGDLQILHGHGEASSPALHGDTLVVNWDHEGASFVVALEARTGKERWRQMRDEVTSWATPLVVEHGGRTQVVISGTRAVRGYDLATGSVIWECGGLSSNIVASPVAGDGMVFAGSSYDTRAFLAIRLDGAAGDITATDRVAWRKSSGTPYVPSPLLLGEAIYYLKHYQPIISRLEAKTGRNLPGAVRLEGLQNIYASPVAAAGRVYVTDLEGTTLVFDHANPARVLARNRLDDSFSASAALAGKDLYLRGRRSLYALRSAPETVK